MSNQGFKPEATFNQEGFRPSTENFSSSGFQQQGFSSTGFKPVENESPNNGFTSGGFAQGGFQPTEEKFNSQGFTKVNDVSQSGTDSFQNIGYQPQEAQSQKVKRTDLEILRQAIARSKQSLAEAEEILNNIDQED